MTGRDNARRASVLAALGSAGTFRSAQEVYADLRAAGAGIGLSTVYRHLQALAEASRLDSVRGADGEVRYRRCTAAAHHHHLVCRTCGAAVEVSATAVETWAAQVAADQGYAGVTHEVELFGTCPACQRGAAG